MTKIIVVEDDVSFRNVLVQMLKNSGYFVQQAGDGDQALEICCEFDPDIVITDIIMPNKEGLETIQDLMAIKPGIKIIAMSGGGKYGPYSYLPLALKLGAKAVLEKPFMRNEMIEVIEKVLNS